MPETRGKSLEEIDASFQRKHDTLESQDIEMEDNLVAPRRKENTSVSNSGLFVN